MVEAYNFISSWQLFPERGTYESGERPKSGIYRIELGNESKVLKVNRNWVSVEDHSFNTQYAAVADNKDHPLPDSAGDSIRIEMIDSITFEVSFSKEGQLVSSVLHEITPKGYLQITQKYFNGEQVLTNVETYHKQMSVLPYSSSVSGAVIKPTEEGMIRHTALKAMEEQTNMQLVQIRQQIELLALQAKQIQKRKELSMIVYNAKISFAPVIGQTYYLYENDDETHLVSMVSPAEWGKKLPFKSFVGAVQLLADHTWKEL
ncbi:hypothetical protein WSM22_20750 [Cytophagales bacterium WSM2-2]|nr:hypothetical protein WSM22_20750 [Cytophagales bacterium WSM2-2]